MKVTWKSGSRFASDAEAVYAEVTKVAKKHGGDATPELVVEMARNPKSAAHHDFEWDDAIAAKQSREATARKMLRSFVEYREDVSTTTPQRVFEIVTTKATETQKPRNVYRHIDDVMADPDARADLLGRALKDLIAFRNRFKHLQELAIVLRAVDEVLAKVKV